MFKSFIETWADSSKLSVDLEKWFKGYESEFFNYTNWFLTLEDIYKIIWNVFASKSANKYFIWREDNTNLSEFKLGIYGQFIPLLWSEFINFYKEQLMISANDLNELKDWKNRGTVSHNINNTAGTSYNQPSEKGYKWDNETDAPTDKRVNDNTQTLTNRIKDLTYYLENRISIYFINMFCKFEYMFIDKDFIDDYMGTRGNR